MGTWSFGYLYLEKCKTEKGIRGPGPVAEWLSLHALLWLPRVLPVRILDVDMALLIRPCWGHVPHATTRRTHNYVLGGFGEKNQEKNKKIGNSC